MTNDSLSTSTSPAPADPTPGPLEYEDRVLGCLLGGSAGDAYGMLHAAGRDPVEALRDPSLLAVSSATSLTLYTVDGLVEALEWANDGVAADETACLWLAYLRWLRRQGEHLPPHAPAPPDRWLDRQTGLLTEQQPDRDTLQALLSGEMGTRLRPLDSRSAGPGALIRSAPFGLVPRIPASMAERLTLDAAALTHGAQEATAPAATYSAIIRALAIDGQDLTGALGSAAETGPPAAGATAEPTAAGTLHAAVQGVLAGTATNTSPREQFVRALAHTVKADAPGASPVAASSLAGGIMGALHGTSALPDAYLSSSGTPEIVRAVARTLLRQTSGE